MTDSSNFGDVGDFHRKFDLPIFNGEPHEASPELIEFRTKFLEEELEEFRQGVEAGDHEQMFDALLDLTYVAMGTAHVMGYPWQAGWDEVQRANMAKERASSDGSNSKRLSSYDVIKPEGWVPPQIAEILAMYGFVKIAEPTPLGADE